MCLDVAYIYSLSKIRIRYDCWVKKMQSKSYLTYDLASLMGNTILNVPSRFFESLSTLNEEQIIRFYRVKFALQNYICHISSEYSHFEILLSPFSLTFSRISIRKNYAIIL